MASKSGRTWKGVRDRAPRRGRPWGWLRAALFGLVVLAVAGAVYGLWPRSPEAPESFDRQLTVTMAGFNPAVIEAPAGSEFVLWIVNPDNSFHADGGGVHGFTVPELGIDMRVQPESTELVRLPADMTPGEYAFYCDTCCGGKENPSMQGVIRVRPA